MTNGLSVIIVTRNEPMCEFTVRRALETADCPIDVVVVHDGPPEEGLWDALEQSDVRVRQWTEAPAVGLAYCRDVGLRMALNDACLVLDAHCNFEGHGWASHCRDHALAHPKHIACCVSVQLDSDPWSTPDEQMDMAQRREEDGTFRPRGAYYGATIQVMERSNGRPFPSKWHGEYQELVKDGGWGVIQSILGGQYVLNKKWYLGGLQRPWQHNLAWGTSEQSISIPNWLCGGESVLLPIRIGHQYRSGKQARAPYPYDVRMRIGQLWNQYKLIQGLPLRTALQQQLLDVVLGMNPPEWVDEMLKLDTGQAMRYRAFLSEQSRTMAEYFERFAVDLADIPSVAQLRAGWEPSNQEGK